MYVEQIMQKKRVVPVNLPQDHCKNTLGDCTTTEKPETEPTCPWPALGAVRVIRERLAWQSFARRVFVPTA